MMITQPESENLRYMLGVCIAMDKALERPSREFNDLSEMLAERAVDQKSSFQNGH